MRQAARCALLSIAIGVAALACTSPEATRTRAGGPGADVGNRGDIELHAGADMYHGTPTLLPRARGGEASASPRTQ
jgi:hypothetical protein